MSGEDRGQVQAGAKQEGLVGRDPDGAVRLRVRRAGPRRQGERSGGGAGGGAARVSKSSVQLVRGAAKRHKVIEVQGIEKEALEARISAALEAEGKVER